MNINAEIKLIDITTRAELLEHYEGIAELFSESFNKPLDKKLWEWAYIENPFGEPLVSVAIYKDKLIGHYAVVPMDLENKAERLSGFLSMTTMVAVDFRKHKLFQLLAEMVYDRIHAMKAPAIVFGFPNDNSAPGFVKRLGWSISEDYKVVSVKKTQLNSVFSIIENLLNEDFFTLSLENPVIETWRTNKPNQPWKYENGLGLKEIRSAVDLMHISNLEHLKVCEFETKVNMILPLSDDLVDDDIEIAFPYRFGYRLFNTVTKPELFVQMSMSDIF